MAVVRFMFKGRGPEGSGRSAQIEELFRAHNETLLRFLRARLPSEADAVEAAQEAYVRLLQLDKVEPTYLRAYLFRTAENVARDMKRRRNTRTRAGELPGGIEGHDAADPLDAGQEARLAAVQELKIAERALQQLPPRCREALLLRRRDGWPVARIAEHLGVSTRMVSLYLERALEHLQAALAAEPMGARR